MKNNPNFAMVQRNSCALGVSSFAYHKIDRQFGQAFKYLLDRLSSYPYPRDCYPSCWPDGAIEPSAGSSSTRHRALAAADSDVISDV
jgi:hypothetical protein